jgi:hypothetical protein
VRPIDGDELDDAPWSDDEPPDDVELYGQRPTPISTPLPRVWAEPEDRGTATLSDLGDVEYVENLIPPGRILVWAAEEGSGKSTTVNGELGIRVAAAGGALAGTWSILRTGPVLVLSEMHADDDYAYERDVLASLQLDRSALVGRYFRLPLLTAAGGPAVLSVEPWRSWIVDWLRDHEAILLIIDTATGAAQVEPWGKALQEVFRSLRGMLEAYPALAIVLTLHLKKPNGRSERRISDVLGEWGRWSDVLVLQQADGRTRTKIETMKRVRQRRRIVATQAGGLLVDPVDLDTIKGPKIPLDDVAAAIAREPGASLRVLAKALGVATSTATKYVRAAEEAGLAYRVEMGSGRGFRVFPTESGVDTLALEDRPPVQHRPTSVLDTHATGQGEGVQGGTVQPSTQPEGVDGPSLDTPPSEPIDQPDIWEGDVDEDGYGPGAIDLDPEPVPFDDGTVL